jgi:hypothetical protein
MKLELKYLAPYLPYGLKWVITNENLYEDFEFDFEEGTLDKGTIWELFLVTTKDIEFYGGECSDFAFKNNLGSEISYCGGIKPILRPLSHLTKEIEETEECLLDYIVEKLERHCVNYDDWVASAIEDGIETRILQAPYEVIEYCFENHYDVFGLIPRGLAIDINTIKI